jgi:hypothetical protein
MALTEPTTRIKTMDINKTPYFSDYDNYETLEEAVKAASKTCVRRGAEEQIVYKAVKVISQKDDVIYDRINIVDVA